MANQAKQVESLLEQLAFGEHKQFNGGSNQSRREHYHYYLDILKSQESACTDKALQYQERLGAVFAKGFGYRGQTHSHKNRGEVWGTA